MIKNDSDNDVSLKNNSFDVYKEDFLKLHLDSVCSTHARKCLSSRFHVRATHGKHVPLSEITWYRSWSRDRPGEGMSGNTKRNHQRKVNKGRSHLRERALSRNKAVTTGIPVSLFLPYWGFPPDTGFGKKNSGSPLHDAIFPTFTVTNGKGRFIQARNSS